MFLNGKQLSSLLTVILVEKSLIVSWRWRWRSLCPVFVRLQAWHCLVALGVSCLDFGSRVSNRPAVFIEEPSEYDS